MQDKLNNNIKYAEKYSKNIILPEIGKRGQRVLSNSKVLIIGAGGLGNPVLLYLAASGIGHLGIIDDDKVSISNLQRQVIYGDDDVGKYKVDVCFEKISKLHQDLDLKIYKEKLSEENAVNIIKEYDVIADCSDNFPTRFLINDICIKQQKILVSSAIDKFQGQLYCFKGYLEDLPCYRCFCPNIENNNIPDCSANGVVGAIAGIMGSMQAMQIIKEILQIGESLAGNIILYDAINLSFRKIKLPKDKNCLHCNLSELKQHA